MNLKEDKKMAKNVSNRSNNVANNRPFSLKATKKTQKLNYGYQQMKMDLQIYLHYPQIL